MKNTTDIKDQARRAANEIGAEIQLIEESNKSCSTYIEFSRNNEFKRLRISDHENSCARSANHTEVIFSCNDGCESVNMWAYGMSEDMEEIPFERFDYFMLKMIKYAMLNVTK